MRKQLAGLFKSAAKCRKALTDVTLITIGNFLQYFTHSGITGEHFAQSFRLVPKTPIIAIFSSCFSGSLLDDPVSRLPDVVALMTSSRADEFTYNRPVEQDYWGSSATMWDENFGVQFLTRVAITSAERALGKAFLQAQSYCPTWLNLGQRPQALFRVKDGQLAINGALHRCL